MPSRQFLSESDWKLLDTSRVAGSWSARLSDHPRDAMTIPGQEGGLLIEFEGTKPWWLDEAVASLDRIVNLPDDWDGYGGRRPTLMAAKQALEILDEVLSPGVPLPSIVPTNRGGIQLEWHRQGFDLEVEIMPDHSISAYLDDPGGRGEQEWDLSTNRSALRNALLLMLQRGQD